MIARWEEVRDAETLRARGMRGKPLDGRRGQVGDGPVAPNGSAKRVSGGREQSETVLLPSPLVRDLDDGAAAPGVRRP